MVIAAVSLLAAACGGDDDAPAPTEGASATEAPQETPSPSPAPTGSGEDEDTAALRHVNSIFSQWSMTDPDTLIVDPLEIVQGCRQGRGCITALDAEGAVEVPIPVGRATFASVTEVEYTPTIPVGYVDIDGEVRGYPLHILLFHEIVNDLVGDTPVAITYCPLCNSALAFDRRIDGDTLDFSVSGLLRNSDLIMFDRQTESWWQQLTGEALAGVFAGETLTPLAMPVVSYEDFAAAFPDALILTEDTGFSRLPYGNTQYAAYDDLQLGPGRTPTGFTGEIDTRLPGLDRVVSLERDGEALAVPFVALSEAGVANVTVGGERIAVLWAPGTVSILDAPEIAAAEDIGSAVAFDASAGDQTLTFDAVSPGVFRDQETGSLWDASGLATEGPLAGERLAPVPHANHFWFAWAAFNPETEIWSG